MDLRCCLVIVVFTCCHTFVWKVKGEYFTSVYALEVLLRTKDEVVNVLDEYLKGEKERLEKIQRYKEEYMRMFQNESSDALRIVTNPINAYVLIKRLTTDWQALRQLLRNCEAVMEKAIAERPHVHFPSEEDLEGAVEGLVRLQKVYELRTTALADGYILGTKSAPELSAGDCVQIGHQMYNAKDYEYCARWMKESLYRSDKELSKTTGREEVLEILAYSLYMEGNLQEALGFTNELLELVPDHSIAKGNKEYYEYALSKNAETNSSVTPQEEDSPWTSNVEGSMPFSKALCREEKVLTATKESKLRCHYSHGSNPYFLFQPFKVEPLMLDPEILLYHNFLTDEEIEIVISLAKPRLKRAAVADTEERKGVYSSHRISKFAWINDDDHSIIRKINRKIEGATGFTLSTAEQMQVLNYGIGGYYDVHFDFARGGKYFRDEVGDRIATWLNYMSDVDAGGATVFPEIGVSVKPEKGSAVFWFNLLKNGTGDVRTRHTACPVLLGSKWVSNKWIHERGQEFIRKCGRKNE